MKVIDLYNKMAKGEEVPRKFTYKGYLWEYDVKNKMWFYYFGESKSLRFDRLFYMNMILNDEVEILEEEKKIPEKIKNYTANVGRVDDSNIEKYIHILFEQQSEIIHKFDELIDYLESKGNE